jgi:hypothetical protein
LYDFLFTAKEEKMTTRKCPYCHIVFVPTPRGGGKQQKICGKLSCKKALKTENNARWRRENPTCCVNEYPRIKEWLNDHPGYLKQYRADHPEYVQKNRVAQRQRDQKKRTRLDIQARIREQLPDITKQLKQFPNLDIQASKTIQPLEMTLLLGSFSCLDIQIQIAKSIPLEHNFIIQTGGNGHANQTGS